MAKKIVKKVQKIETAKISQTLKSEKTNSIEDLKLMLSGVKTDDTLSNLKNKLNIDSNDPFAELKKSLVINNQEEIVENEVIDEIIIEEEIELEPVTKEEIVDDILEDYESESEEEIVEELIEIEAQEEIVENEIIAKEEVNIINEVIIEDLTKYYYKYVDSYSNNILVREVEKRKDEKIIVHIALNNLEHENFKLKTSSPFEIYHKGVKILDFYQFKKETSTSYNFKKDIYILRNNLVIDSKTYLLEEIEIVNINL